jgi:hypothetical protein
MFTGWWLPGADQTKEEVVDTSGLTFTITGWAKDGSLELEIVFDADGYLPLEQPHVEPDISSNYDPAPYDPPYEPLGYGVIE